MTVRRSASLAVLVLLAVILPAHAANPPDRVVQASYSGAGGVSTGTGATLLDSPTLTATARSDEDRVTVVATQSPSLPVALVVDVTRPRTATTRTVVCNRFVTAVSPGTTVAVTPVAGRCPDGSVSTPHQGTLRVSFRRKPPPTAAPVAVVGAPPASRWAVVIGIGDYAGSTHSTVGGVGDAKAVRAALLASGWRSDHIKMVIDSQATATGIRAAFDWLAARSTPRTFSLMHFSGHVCIASRGSCPSGHTYLWSHDNRFIPETEVVARMKKVRGYSWLDVAGCEAGAFQISSPTRMFTASSRWNETSYEHADWRQSVFAGLLWDRGYTRGLADPQGRANRATIAQMAAYAQARAPSMTAKNAAGPQHPVVAGGSSSWSLYAPPGG